MNSINLAPHLLMDWPALMEQYEQGPLNRKQFCETNHISLSQFKYHRQKLKRPSTTPPPAALIPITLKALLPEDQPSDHFQLLFSHNVRCYVPAHFNPRSLKQLIEVLQSC